MPAPGSQDGVSIFHRRQSYERLRHQLDIERGSYKSQWQDLSDYILPRRARFFVTDSNKGDRRNLKILDSTATLAARTTRSGMMAGITNPANPWFKFALPDAELTNQGEVKQWLHTSVERMRTVFLRSNLYNVLPVLYGDIATFGTAAMFMEEDFESVLRFYPFPVGSYMIANDEKLRVRVFIREFRMTVRQVVSKFGMSPQEPGKIDWSNISLKTKSLWESNNPEAWIDVVHLIKPNEYHDPKKPQSKYKKFISVYYEQGSAERNTNGFFSAGIDDDRFLSEKGYDYFPVLCPRWETTAEDVYGTSCPGMTAIGDIKQLQIGEKRSLQAIEKMINPPLIAPTSLTNKSVSILPADTTYVDERNAGQGLGPFIR